MRKTFLSVVAALLLCLGCGAAASLSIVSSNHSWDREIVEGVVHTDEDCPSSEVFRFRPQARRASVANVYWGGLLSCYIYDFRESKQSLTPFERSLKNTGFEAFRVVNGLSHEESDNRFFFLEHKEFISLVFRGTVPYNLKNLATDFRFFTSATGWGKHWGQVHTGFLNASREAWGRLLPLIKGTQKPIFVSGHSLGAAVATLITAQLVRNGYDVRGLYTFGSPRVGDKAFAETFMALADFSNFPIARFVNGDDPVPRIPFLRFSNEPFEDSEEGAFGRFVHVGSLYYFDRDGRLVRDMGELLKVENSVLYLDTTQDWIKLHIDESYFARVRDVYHSGLDYY